MKSISVLSLFTPIFFSLVTAAPLDTRGQPQNVCPQGVGSSPSKPHMDSFADDERLMGTKLGTTYITPRCLNETTHGTTSCAIRLPTGNKIVMAWNQPVKEDYPDCDFTHPVDNGLPAGLARAEDGCVKEHNDYAIFPNFPSEAAGKQCRFHFITDDGVNIIPGKFRDWDIYSLKSGVANRRTTWNTKPIRDQKVATVSISSQLATRVEHSQKYDHKFVSGPGYGAGGSATFPCPAPGASVAWEITVADHEKAKWQANWTDPASTVEMFIGGVLGLGIELVDVPEKSYGWQV